jgi:CRP/FNR family transcriptional regulator
MGDEPSKIVAVAEEDTTLWLLPVAQLRQWVTQHPRINLLFFHQYNQRYAELIDTINALLFGRLDQRVLQYLREKSRLKSEAVLQLRHRQIAQDLGTAREVVTRVMKRLEQEGKIKQGEGRIEIL